MMPQAAKASNVRGAPIEIPLDSIVSVFCRTSQESGHAREVAINGSLHHEQDDDYDCWRYYPPV